MLNRFFSAAMLEIVLHPEAWMLVSSAQPDIPPVENREHQQWMEENSHRHPHQEIVLMLRGEGCQGFNGAVYPYRPGTVFFFDAFQPHDLAFPPTARDLDQLWIVVMQNHLVVRIISLRDGEQLAGEWRHLISLEASGLFGEGGLLDLHAQADLPAGFARMKIFSAIAMLVSALVQAGYDPPREDEDSAQQQIITTMQQYIQDTAGNGATLEQLARIAGYSKYHFLRLFQRYTGKTVHAYVDLCRREKVKSMLNDRCSQKEIAAALGFSCESAFSRWYKKNRPQG